MAMSTKLSVVIYILSLIEIGPQEQVTSEYTAPSVNTDPVVVRRLTSQLKKVGLIHSVRGANKNTLLKKPEEISLYEIYTAVGLEREIFNIHQDPDPNCSVGANIQSVLETEFTKVQQKVEEKLKSTTLTDVIHEIEVKRDK